MTSTAASAGTSWDLGALPVECKVASNHEERAEAFRLVHHSYVRSGLIEPNRFEMRVTPYHLLPTTDVFVAKHEAQIVCTASLVRDGELGVPMETIYPAEIAELRSQQIGFAEVSSLADRREDPKRFFPVFMRLVQLIVPFARRLEVERVLVAVHPRHARFYQRFLKFQVIGDLRNYPRVRNHPALALCLDFAWLEREHPFTHRQLFGALWSPEELRPHPMPAEEREHFQPAADDAGQAIEACAACNESLVVA